MEAATSATVTGWGNSRFEPSGNVMTGIVLTPETETGRHSKDGALPNLLGAIGEPDR
jgi:hypothetical protein